MDYSIKYRVFGKLMGRSIESYIANRVTHRDIMYKYQKIILDSKEIGRHNQMALFYAISAFFIAMNKCDNMSAEQNYHILSGALQNDYLFHFFAGNVSSYLSEKRIKKHALAAQQSRRRLYQNNWVVDALPKTKEYDVGYDFLSCAACKLCIAENCQELNHYLCNLHFLLINFSGVSVSRTTTLAQGFKRCDFRISRP